MELIQLSAVMGTGLKVCWPVKSGRLIQQNKESLVEQENSGAGINRSLQGPQSPGDHKGEKRAEQETPWEREVPLGAQEASPVQVILGLGEGWIEHRGQEADRKVIRSNRAT